MRSVFTATSTPPSLAILQAAGSEVSLSCTMATAETAHKEVVRLEGSYAVVADGFVYSSIGASLANASDAYLRLERLLIAAGTRMEEMLSCHYFLRRQVGPFPSALFKGFFITFNQAHPPPPTRAEYVAPSYDSTAPEVLVQCIAAMPFARSGAV